MQRVPKVGIVTPIHNDWPATSRFLESVAVLTYPDVEMIIVDDGSTDGSARLIAERFPGVVVVPGDGSLWWTAATNAGAEEALHRGARFIFTCNNDVILDPQVITSSVDCALSSGRSLVGAVAFYQHDPDRVWFAGAHLDQVTGDIMLETDLWPATEDPKETRMLTGMGMLIPAEVFRELGGFDNGGFPHYLADSDFSLRAAALGNRLLVSRDSKIFNDVSSAWSAREFERGRLRFLAQLLFSKRSPYWIRARGRFYRRHWGRGWIRALLRLYGTWFSTYAGPILKRRVLSLIAPRAKR